MNQRHGWRVFNICIFVLSAFFTQTTSLASEYCSRTKTEILTALSEPQNRISFKNTGGIANGGVCWWHSRLQRSSIYLTTYAPEKPKPTKKQATQIVRALTFITEVVEIPGYSNFFDFTQDFQDIIQKELNHWQARDGFINQQWIRGISGKWSVPAEQLRARMVYIYEALIDSPAGLWVMTQMKGIVSHAVLITRMVPHAWGYEISVIDSNQPDLTRVLEYQYGDESILLGSDRFTPYLGFQKDFQKIKLALDHHCQ